MGFEIVTRVESGLTPIVYNNDGRTPRPPLRNEPYVTYHYTGVNRSYATADVSAHLRHLNTIWAGKKNNEYNYVIGQVEDDKVFEFAGKFQAAHSAGENHEAVGIYFLNGISDPLTDTQVRKAQWVRDVLIADGVLRAQPDQRPHQWMPGANTACPGDLIMSRLTEIVKPYVEPEMQFPYNPALNQWGLYPHLPKRSIRQGDEGGDVLYLNDALRLTSGQNVCGDVFNAATTRAVRNFQKFWKLTIDGIVGPAETWPLLDWLVKRL